MQFNGNVGIFFSQSQKSSTSSDDDASPLMRALDPDEREQFKGMESQNESLLNVVEARNRKREEYNDVQNYFPKEMMIAEVEGRRNTIQALAQQIAQSKQQPNGTEKSK